MPTLRPRACALLVALAACEDVSVEETVFACDPSHPCPTGEVCSGDVGVCLDHAVLLYEDFEQPLDATRWSLVETNGLVEAPAETAHWGQGGMRAEVAATGGVATIDHVLAGPLPAETYVRWFVRQTTFADSASYLKLETADEAAVLTVGNESGRLVIKGGRDPNYQSASMTGSLVADAWTCVEVALTGLPQDGDGTLAARVSVNGTEAAELRVTVPTRRFELVRAGTASLGPSTIALDDIVIDAVPVGCAR